MLWVAISGIYEYADIAHALHTVHTESPFGRRHHTAPFVFLSGIERYRSAPSVPKMCQKYADLAILDEQAERKYNNLRICNGSGTTDSVPGHQISTVSETA